MRNRVFRRRAIEVLRTLGAAGLRPVVEVMLMNFTAVCMDQITNHAAKIRFMSGGQTHVPMVIRTMTGSGFGTGGQHAGRGEDSRNRGNHNATNAEQPRHVDRMQWPPTSKSHQHHVTGVLAPLDGNGAYRARHIDVGDLADAVPSIIDAELQWTGDMFLYRSLGKRSVDRERATGKRMRDLPITPDKLL